jgi:hypothetical protein
MKVSELKQCLKHSKDDDNVMVAIKLPYVTVGVIPMTPVKLAFNGFDWENGNFILTPKENLTPSDSNFAKQMKDMQDKLGWSEYENRGLKAEIKRLKKQIGVEE